MGRICIFCLESKDKMMPEHVFPDAIGGGFIINNVCAKCNQQLGRKIDTPLANFEMVTFYRKQFKIAKVYRQIRNPLKGKFEGQDGKMYTADITENGIETKIITQFDDPIQHEDGTFTANVIMSEKDFKGIDETINKFVRKFKIDPVKSGLQVKSLDYFNSPQPDIKLNLTPDPFILGTLKIAYECASTFINRYYLDYSANEIRSILLNGNIEKYRDIMYDDDMKIREHFVSEFAKLKYLDVIHHATILQTIPNIGLCCGVKIFNWIYAFVLSKRTNYIDCHQLKVINNAKTRKFNCDIPIHVANCKYTCDISMMKREYKRVVRHIQSGEIKFNGKYTAIYDSRGALVHKSMYELRKYAVVRTEHFKPNSIDLEVPIVLPRNRYFLKTKNNILVPLSQIKFIYNFGVG